MSSLEKWALITGVSKGGLGDALATELMSRQMNVIATGLKLSHLEYLEPTSSAKLEKLQLDVTSPASISTAVERVETITNGQLFMLINNAGYGYMMPLIHADMSSIKQNFDVNVFGLLAVTQAFFPALRAANGLVVNQASISGLGGLCQPFIGTYSASKSAVVDLSNTLRVELAPFGVGVVTLITGDVKTQFWDNVQGAHAGLPDSSPYQPIKAKAEAMMRGETNPPGQHSAEKWAKAVVNDLLKPHPPSHIRRGYLATTMSWVSWLTPSWLFDWMFTQVAELGKLKSALSAQERKKIQ